MRSVERKKSAEIVDMRRIFAGLFVNSTILQFCVVEVYRSFLKKVFDDL